MNVDGLAALPLLTDPETVVWSPSTGDRGLGALSTSRGNLPLRRVVVSARIEGLFAQVEVEQTFANEGDDPLEAIYIFPLPERMALQAMSLQVDDRDVKAVIQERGAARREYRAAAEEGRPAAMVEEDRPGVFTLQVGAIPPGEEATVRITLVGMIPCTNREATFRFPLVVAPRFVPGVPLPGASVGAGAALDTDAVPDASRLSPPVLLPGNPYPVRLSIRVFVDPAGMPASDFRSSLHTIRESRNDAGGVCVTLAQHERLDRDFVLRWKLVHPETISQLLVAPDRDGSWNGTFALTIAPPPPAPGSRKPRDVAFVVDHSASTAGWRLAGTKSALRRLIGALTPSDRLMVLGIGEYCTWPAGFNPTRLSPAGAVEQDAALAFLDRLQSIGGGDLAVPFGYAVSTLNAAAALSPSAGTDRERVLVLVAGGRVANEKEVLKLLPVKDRKIRVLAVGLDHAVNAEFLQQLTEGGGGGVCELVESPERLEEAMERILHLAIGPVATGISLHPVDFGPTQVAPSRLPPLFADTPLVVFGRYSGSPAAPLEIEGTLPGGGEWRASAAVRPTEHPAVAACWARIRLRELEDRYALGRFGNRSKEDFYGEMVRLSIERQVLCRFTAFAAVDRTGAFLPGGRMQTVVQPVEPVAELKLSAPPTPPPSTHAAAAPVRRDDAPTLPPVLPPVAAGSGSAVAPPPSSGPATAPAAAPAPSAPTPVPAKAGPPTPAAPTPAARAPAARAPAEPPTVPRLQTPPSSRLEWGAAAPTKTSDDSATIAASPAFPIALPPPAAAVARSAASTPATALPAPPPSAPRAPSKPAAEPATHAATPASSEAAPVSAPTVSAPTLPASSTPASSTPAARTAPAAPAAGAPGRPAPPTSKVLASAPPPSAPPRLGPFGEPLGDVGTPPSAPAAPPPGSGNRLPPAPAAKPKEVEKPKEAEKPKVEIEGAGAMFRGTFDGGPASHAAAPPPSGTAPLPPVETAPKASPATPPTAVRPPSPQAAAAPPSSAPSTAAFGPPNPLEGRRFAPSAPVAASQPSPAERTFDPTAHSVGDAETTSFGSAVGSSNTAASHAPPSSWGKSDGVWRPPPPLAVGEEASAPSTPAQRFGPGPSPDMAATQVQAIWDGTAWVPAGGSGEWVFPPQAGGDPAANPYAAAWAAYNQAQWNWNAGAPSAEAYAAWYAQQGGAYPQAAPWGYYPPSAGGEGYAPAPAGYIPSPPPASFAQPTASPGLPSTPPASVVPTPPDGVAPLGTGPTGNVLGGVPSIRSEEVPPPPSSVLAAHARIRDTALASSAAPPVADLRATAVEPPTASAPDVRGTEPCEAPPAPRSTTRRSTRDSKSTKKPRPSPATRAGGGPKGRKQLMRRIEALEWQVRAALGVAGLAAVLALLLLLARLRG